MKCLCEFYCMIVCDNLIEKRCLLSLELGYNIHLVWWLSDSVISCVMLSVRGQVKLDSFLSPAVYNPIFCIDSTMSRPSTWSSWSLDVLLLSDIEWMLGRTGRAFISHLFCVLFSVESLKSMCVYVHSGSLGQLPVPAGCLGHSCWSTTVLSELYFQVIWLYKTQ